MSSSQSCPLRLAPRQGLSNERLRRQRFTDNRGKNSRLPVLPNSLIISPRLTGSTASALAHRHQGPKAWLIHGTTDKVWCPAGDSLESHCLENSKTKINVDRKMRGVTAITSRDLARPRHASQALIHRQHMGDT